MTTTYQSAEVTLSEHSSAGNPPKKFPGQTVEITVTPVTHVPSADGHTSPASHCTKIFWLGGAARDFAKITHVKIVASDGEVLIDDHELMPTFQEPKDVSGGVKFEVFREGFPN